MTENGEVINADDAVVPGYGVWRLTEDDFAVILAASGRKPPKGPVSKSISSNLFSNIEYGCGPIANLTESIALSELLEIVNVEPCVSAMSLVTLLQLNGQYPVPVSLAAQEQLLSDVSDQIVIDFQARSLQKMCANLKVLDNEFVDSYCRQHLTWKLNEFKMYVVLQILTLNLL